MKDIKRLIVASFLAKYMFGFVAGVSLIVALLCIGNNDNLVWISGQDALFGFAVVLLILSSAFTFVTARVEEEAREDLEKYHIFRKKTHGYWDED